MRRTPALTAQARAMFEDEVRTTGWQPGGTIPRIAEATGLDPAQVREAVFGPTSDKWRQVARRLHESGDDEPYATDDV